MQCSMTLVNAGSLVWCGEDGHGLNLNCQRAERDHAAASRRRIGPEWCPLFTGYKLDLAMLPRPAWVIFASDPLSAIGVNQTCGGPRAQNPLHHIPV